MKLKKVLTTTLATLFVASTALGIGLATAPKSAVAEPTVPTAEWAVGNENVSAEFGFDFIDGEKDYTAWRYSTYANATPLFYKTDVAATNNASHSINLGYYDGNFAMTWTPIQDCVYNSYSADDPFDFYQVSYTFTNMETGKNFKITSYQWYTSPVRKKAYAALFNENDEKVNEIEICFSFGGKYTGSHYSANSQFTYDIQLNKTSNSISFVRPAGKGWNLADYGIDATTGTYKVDMSFDTIQMGKSAKIAVYKLGGFDLTATQEGQTFESNGAVVYQKASTYACTDSGNVPLNEVVGVWDSVKGDVAPECVVKNAAGEDVTVVDGKFTATSGEYTVTATYGEKSKTFTVNVTAPTPATAEWATGNDSVKVRFGVDVETEYADLKWTTPQSTSNTLDDYVDTLKAEEFWTKGNNKSDAGSYIGLNAMLYETVANAENPSINLGYYNTDFKTAVRPIQSVTKNTYERTADWDYVGLVYTFTDTVTGEYFSVRVRQETGSPFYKRAMISVAVNGGAYGTETFLRGSFGGGFNGTSGSPDSGVWFFINLKYDLDENVIKYQQDLGTSIDLTALGLTAFESYKVDMKFDGVKADKSAKLCVYYLNEYDLDLETKYTLEDNTHSTVLYATEDEVTVSKDNQGVVDTTGLVKGWNSFVGDISNQVTYTVSDPNGETIDLTDGKFTPLMSGAYTVTAQYENVTKVLPLNVAFPEGGILVKSANLNLEGEIGVQFLVSADSARYNADGGKVVFTVAGETTEVAFADWTAYGTEYLVGCQVAAKQMTDEIKVQFVANDDSVSGEFTYSVKQYADTVLNGNYEDDLKALVKAMLNYGAYAQKEFNYNVGNLANAGLWTEGSNPVETMTEVTEATVSKTNEIESVKLTSLSLGLETETQIYVLFELANIDVNEVTFKVGETELTAKQFEGNSYYVVIENVAAKDIDALYTLTATVGDNTATYTLSAQCYISAAFKVEQYGEEYKNLLKAIELYNEAANVYFAN